MPFLQRLNPTAVIWPLLLGMAAGCSLPEYYRPGGFSSTAQRRLDESQVEWPAPQKSAPESVDQYWTP